MTQMLFVQQRDITFTALVLELELLVSSDRASELGATSLTAVPLYSMFTVAVCKNHQRKYQREDDDCWALVTMETGKLKIA